jgi:hypothetical protein
MKPNKLFDLFYGTGFVQKASSRRRITVICSAGIELRVH